jgi:23S rRNA (pseudouridine1915-N3)-methyltransferase
MRLLVVAVGTRMPGWVESGFEEYARRMPRELPLQLVEVKAEPRSGGKPVDTMKTLEASRIRSALPDRCRRVVLDEHGKDLTTAGLARRLTLWQQDSQDVALIIGGPDGLADDLKRDADEKIRLSSLTLPHALVRPLLAEAIYRAWTVTRNHPYHRE